MKIITANYLWLRVECDKCGNVIEAALTAQVVKCACGQEEHIAELREKKMRERSKSRRLDGYLEGYDGNARRSPGVRRIRA